MRIDILRHCESTFNANPDPNISTYDCGLTQKGTEQADKLNGHYDVVVLSPLQRTRQTLELSHITYDKLIICNLARECKADISDCLPDEQFIMETKEDCIKRGALLKKYLLALEYDKILLVTHYNIVWYMTHDIVADELFGVELFGVALNNGEIKSIDL